MDYTAEQINKAFDELPEIVNRVMFRVKIDEKIIEIIKKYGLNPETEPALNTYVTFVIVGLMSVEDFKLNITKGFGLSTEICEKIYNDVNILIFRAIDEKVKELKEEEEILKEMNLSNIPQKLSPSNFDIAENRINDSRPASHFVDLKKAVEDSNYKTKIYALGQKYHLAIDQMGVLEEIINKAVLGNIQPNRINDEIKSKIQISEDKINELVNDLNEEVFKDIRNLLKNQNQMPTEEEVPIPPYKEVVSSKEQVVNIKDIKEIETPVSKIENEKNLNKEEEIGEDEDEIFRNSGIDIIGEKLNKPTVSASAISNHSLPKINSDKNPQTKDPYREEI